MHSSRIARMLARLMPLMAALVLVITGCRQEDDTYIQEKTTRVIEKKVAVIAPLSDPIMRPRLERTAEWMLTNLKEAQQGDSLRFTMVLEWYDEEKEDLKTLGEELVRREDISAIIGPFDNDRLATVATICQKTRKPLIAPTATSESLIRQFAVTGTGDVQSSPFLWSLTETDVTFSEVSLTLYANFAKVYGLPGFNVSDSYSLLITPENSYGRTFHEWVPFMASELDIRLGVIYTFTQHDELLEKMKAFYDSLDEVYFQPFQTPQFVVTDDVNDIYQITRIRSAWMGLDPDDPEVDETIAARSRPRVAPAFFITKNLTDEALASLEQRAVALTDGYMGFSPYADPTTGFEISYYLRYYASPTFAECKFYDALLLTAYAHIYMEHNDQLEGDLNESIIDITTTDNIIKGAAWDRMGMQVYIHAIGQGQLYGFTGASGQIRFDSECYTAALNTTYVNWVINNGKVYNLSYHSRSGSTHTSQMLASWKWLINNPEKTFEENYSGKTESISYPEQDDQYALLVQGSTGWSNYRHEADVMNVYQLLRDNGFDDDHIILITADYAAHAPENKVDQGAVRTETDGRNLYEGAVIDYKNTDLEISDVVNILKGVKTDRTPVVLPAAQGNNLLVFWSGHGHEVGANGVNELAWVSNMAGDGLSDAMLHKTVKDMAKNKQFRKMLLCLEPCYSANMGEAINGIPGVLAISAAKAKEQSFADYRSETLGVWMCDRFSRNLVNCSRNMPQATYRDLYLYCAQNTLGSHVSIHNYQNFGNLHIMSPNEFFYKSSN